MEAYFFGPKDRQLFGAFHEASGSGEHGVVLAYPGPQEYMQCHYAYRLLAGQLTREGCAVLRFDWSGTGDSAGDAGDVSLQRWRDDLLLAVQELTEVSGARKVSVVGYRLGAAVAASTPFGQSLEQLILWEPVLCGNVYVTELRARQRRKFADLLCPPPWWRDGLPNELLGHSISDAHLAEINAFDLVKQMVAKPKHLSIVTQRKTTEQHMLLNACKEQGIDVSLDEIEDAGSHVRDDSMLLPGATLAQVTSILKAV